MLLLIFSLVPFLALGAGGASAAPTTPARSAQTDMAGFPLWYQDANGVRVQVCYDPADPYCQAPVSATYNPALPLSFPGNYPDEFFYSAVDSQLMTVADCPSATAAANPGVSVHLALEGSFLNGTLTPGDQMVFGRIRIKATAGSGLCANSWYTFRTPYGPLTLQTDATGLIRGSVASLYTVDVGCLPGPATPCNFDQVFQSKELQVGLLHLANGAQPAYLGTGAPGVPPGPVFGPIVGGQGDFNQFDVVRWPAGVTPAATGLGADCGADCILSGSTPNFSVLAKLAGPFTSSVPSVDFGGQLVGVPGAAKTVTLTNVGSGPLGLDGTTIDSITVNGADPGDFVLEGTSCALGAVTARDAACDVTLHFTAGALGARSATLDLSLNGGTQTWSMPLVGTGIDNTMAPTLTVNPADGNLAIGPVRLTTASATNNVTITNSGTAPMFVQASLAATPDVAEFAIVANNCPTYLAAGAQCVVGVKFTPTHFGPATAQLDIVNSAGATFVVAITADATGGNAAVGPINALNTQPDWYQDELGIRLGQCDDPNNSLCITSMTSGTATFPSPYPSEWFYYNAASSPIDVSDPACGLVAKGLKFEAAVESAFLGQIAPGQGTTFGRLRLVSQGGLCANSQYLVTHPYGQLILTTDARGAIKPHAGTTDVGCLGAPCDFAITLAAPVMVGFLQQTVHPAGYLGDPLAPSLVTGSAFTDPGTGALANHVSIRPLVNGVPGAVIGGTDQFTVAGRLVGPMVANPAAVQFGSSEVGLAPGVTQTVTFTNTGIAAVTLGTPAFTAPTLTDYAAVAAGANPCSDGLVLAVGSSCTVDVTFLPQLAGSRVATLTLQHSGMNNPLGVTLSGVGAVGTGAAISASLTSVTFPELKIGHRSGSETVIISNLGGTSALQVGQPTVTGPFAITGDTCFDALTTVFVQPGQGCAISVEYRPTTIANGVASEAQTGTLTVPSNAAIGLAPVALAGTVTNTTPAVAAASNAAGFPLWVQDGNGVRLEQCVAQDGRCLLLQDPGFNPANPVVWPTNFPVESFYALADSQTMTVPAQVCPEGVTAGGLALVRLATEATFTTTTATAGAQTWFNRVRVVASGLCANTTYHFVTPYGVVNSTTDGTGAIKAKAGTFDVTNLTASTPLNPAVLRWDPNYNTPPVGYLGDGSSFVKVTGGQYSEVANGEPVNFVRIDGPSGAVTGTDKFLVVGRLAGPVVATPTSKDFGSVTQGTTSTTQSFSISNVSTLPISGFTVASSNPVFFVNSNNCPSGANTLASGASCTVQVQFKPTVADGTGLRSGTITVGYNGLRSPVTISVTGNSIAPGSVGWTVSPTSLAFGNVTVGFTSATQTVSVKNSGTGLLKVVTALAGTNPGQYNVTGTTCPVNGLGSGATCTISVVFKPTSGGSKPASLTVQGLDPVTNVQLLTTSVALSGSGAQGTISLSASTLNITSKAGSSGTGKIVLTNTGTAPWSLTGAPFYSFVAITANNPVPRFSAGQTGCNNVAPGKNCTVTVSFTPPAGAPVNTVYSVTMSMTSDASNSPVSLRVNGTVK